MSLQAHRISAQRRNAPTGQSRGDLKQESANVSFGQPLPSTLGDHNPPLVGRRHHNRLTAVGL
jgi:hypothetical protein